MSEIRRPRYTLSLIWNLALAALIYALGSGFVHTLKYPLLPWGLNSAAAIEIDDKTIPEIIEYLEPEVAGIDAYVKIKFASLPVSVKVNRNANAYNRPHSLVEARDDYLGPRPHVDTEVDFEALMQGCRGRLSQRSLYKNTSHCLNFLKNNEAQYTLIPPPSARASSRDPRFSEYLNSDGRDNSLPSYLTVDDAQPAFNDSRGTCPGPIVPYHVYWRGPTTWHVEIFIKSYLYTQNLACSQLNIWLDSDPFPNAVDDMLHNDPLFARFRPLVERGDIALRAWHFPSTIPLSPENDALQGRDYNDTVIETRDNHDSNAPFRIFDRRSSEADRVTLSQKQKSFLPTAVSDAVRFVVLHLHGGGYFDMDVLMLRDMRPLYLPRNHSFAERWSTYKNGGFNTAIMSLTANSSLSAYFLKGAVSMGLNFHPLILGIMSQKDGRNQELQMLEHGLFDPLWARYAGDEIGPCPVPCFRGDYSKAFKGGRGPLKGEWRTYRGPRLTQIQLGRPPPTTWKTGLVGGDDGVYVPPPDETASKPLESGLSKPDRAQNQKRDISNHDPVNGEFLFEADVIKLYDITKDKWPVSNRTLENFFRGAYTYHIHNQWDSRPEPNSWLNVIERAHDRFFAGEAPNPYGEMWNGPPVPRYRTWVDFL